MPRRTSRSEEGLRESPLAFGASPEDDFASSPETIRERFGQGPDWALLGAFEGRLVGAVGLMRQRSVKVSHKALIWGMYVTPTHRGRGWGPGSFAPRSSARTLPGVTWVHLGVTSTGARRLYERAGFRAWGAEPDALRHDGEAVVEHHMALRL